MTVEGEAALLELASAYRGDWSDFDGRSLRDAIHDVLRVENGTMPLETFRGLHCLCPHGEGHWEEYCEMYCSKPKESNG